MAIGEEITDSQEVPVELQEQAEVGTEKKEASPSEQSESRISEAAVELQGVTGAIAEIGTALESITVESVRATLADQLAGLQVEQAALQAEMAALQSEIDTEKSAGEIELSPEASDESTSDTLNPSETELNEPNAEVTTRDANTRTHEREILFDALDAFDADSADKSTSLTFKINLARATGGDMATLLKDVDSSRVQEYTRDMVDHLSDTELGEIYFALPEDLQPAVAWTIIDQKLTRNTQLPDTAISALIPVAKTYNSNIEQRIQEYRTMDSTPHDKEKEGGEFEANLLQEQDRLKTMSEYRSKALESFGEVSTYGDVLAQGLSENDTQTLLILTQERLAQQGNYQGAMDMASMNGKPFLPDSSEHTTGEPKHLQEIISTAIFNQGITSIEQVQTMLESAQESLRDSEGNTPDFSDIEKRIQDGTYAKDLAFKQWQSSGDPNVLQNYFDTNTRMQNMALLQEVNKMTFAN